MTVQTKYPELKVHADRIANEACRLINEAARSTNSEMPYKSQWILETVIADLERRV